MELIFKFEEFEGPLDLIIFLVQKKKLSVREIPISQLADEFYEYIKKMKEFNLKLTSEFIATAAYLMELKSKSLLPRSNEDSEFQKKKEKFYSQVEQYAKIKEFTEKVKSVEKLSPKKVPISVKAIFPKINEKKLKKLITSILKEVELKQKIYKIKREEISLETIMSQILTTAEEDIITILKNSKSKYEVILKFLAILELIKMNKIVLEENLKIRRIKNG
ncbi:chromosome segregation protein ScpA [Thermosipho melanesiensis]|uniref:Segregation and condensation protein A n=2 Tax=Thermosipho melanesiensis TaxID=46541 RepID=A6LMK1_THEM4|nr:ScpA family protein [Thermosipho melanesiensis]ABR31152.1 chromosome segregation and condensation protein ScpA [Thermosipho melanesiensis BI429]APT74242.1 chromosome segregation protein ScpA [Thermosipho melanesiensis]OOC36183.1 chromosome segregation protein ScpA [Thermosipho melanesiensis]OOC37001.1 chromosome segregation protein ScpA [Thermosipho melanesiensis]OOC37753.1 chromosome segregation protein ScpA [Thermosipho melanesiensis]